MISCRGHNSGKKVVPYRLEITVSKVFPSIYGLIKNQHLTVWKLGQWELPLCVWQSVFEMSWTRLECAAQVCIKIQANLFFCCSLVKKEPSWLFWEEPKFKTRKVLLVAWILIKQPYEAHRLKYLHIFYVFRPTCVFALSPSLTVSVYRLL